MGPLPHELSAVCGERYERTNTYCEGLLGHKDAHLGRGKRGGVVAWATDEQAVAMRKAWGIAEQEPTSAGEGIASGSGPVPKSRDVRTDAPSLAEELPPRASLAQEPAPDPLPLGIGHPQHNPVHRRSQEPAPANSKPTPNSSKDLEEPAPTETSAPLSFVAGEGVAVADQQHDQAVTPVAEPAPAAFPRPCGYHREVNATCDAYQGTDQLGREFAPADERQTCIMADGGVGILPVGSAEHHLALELQRVQGQLDQAREALKPLNGLANAMANQSPLHTIHHMTARCWANRIRAALAASGVTERGDGTDG